MMKNYAILCNPGHNRVYFEESKRLGISELAAFVPAANDIQGVLFADIYYISFGCDVPLSDSELARIARLSFFYALFEVVETDCKTTLIPTIVPDVMVFGDDLLTILKYTGKTNEIFTRLLINAAFGAVKNPPVDAELNLLDPVAGKGTTLFEALTRGWNAYGVEVGGKAAREGVQYFKKYLETSKIKHAAHTERVSGSNKSFSAERHTITINKEQTFEMVSGNSMYTDKLFKKNHFHIIAGDLPYGVQHGNVTNEGQSQMTRSPRELLNACLPAWHTVLRSGGALALSWNTLVFPRTDMEKTLERHGFTVLSNEIYTSFGHRVDNSIYRDVVVARK